MVHISNALPVALLTGALFVFSLIMPTGVSYAQWQRAFGDSSAQSGRAGVQRTFDKGFVACGESDTVTSDYDLYVVKTDSNGVRQWAYRYDIGGNDYGRCIQQTADSGYIVTGYTEDTANCCSRDNAFIMKLSRGGNVQWTRTYGDDSVEQGWYVRQLSSEES